MPSTICQSGFKRLKPSGLFTATLAKDVMEQFKLDLEAGVRWIVVDLREVSFMDSFGLGVLVSMHSRLKMTGGQLHLCHLSGSVQSLFDISRSQNHFEVGK